MKKRIKILIKRIVPKFFVFKLLNYLERLKAVKAKKVFCSSSRFPASQEKALLETLKARYSAPPEYGYDSDALKRRGQERAEDILNLVPKHVENFLELGCWDGMVSCALKQKGKKATAIDFRSTGFDERAREAGVNLLEKDAGSLDFQDQTFDLVFAFDAIEHFKNLDKVLAEALRVTKKGGYIYFRSGPLYMSPWGLHAYKLVPVPYCQLLFSKEVLDSFVKEKGVGPIDYDQLNCWKIEDYRKLWDQYSGSVQKVKYCEKLNASYVDLIIKYPTCFKNKTDNFDDFIVAGIEVLFKKV